MARQKCDGRRKATRSAKVSSNRPKTYSSYGKSATHNILLRKSMVAINRGLSFRQAEEKFGISISTLHRYFNKIKDAVDDSSVVSLYTVRKTISKASQKNQLLTSTEEDSIVKYILFESARGFPISVRIMKSHIREVLLKAKEKGEKRPEINMVNGPSSKFMRGFFSRHPEVSFRQAERVDRGRINQASRQTYSIS